MFLTPAQLQSQYLNGLVLADPKGRPMPDAAIENHIRSAAAAFQRRYSLCLTPTHVRLGRERLKDAEAAADLPLVYRDAPPYMPRAFQESRHGSIRLPLGPVMEVHALALKLPGSAVPVAFSRDWIQVDYKNQVIQVYPGSTGLTPAAFNALGMYSLSSGRTIPNAWQVSYTAGLTDEQLQGEYADVAHALAALAALAVLVPGSIDRFTQAGVTGLSASVDGLSQNTQLSQQGGQLKYASLIAAFQNDVQEWDKRFRARQGVMVAFL